MCITLWINDYLCTMEYFETYIAGVILAAVLYYRRHGINLQTIKNPTQLLILLSWLYCWPILLEIAEKIRKHRW